MDWKKMIGFGLLIWVIMFAIVSVFIALNIYDPLWGKILTILISGIVGIIFGRLLKTKILKMVLGYIVIWVVIGLVLDYVVTMRFEPAIFAMWSLWVGYVLLIIGVIVGVMLGNNNNNSEKVTPPSPKPGSPPPPFPETDTAPPASPPPPPSV